VAAPGRNLSTGPRSATRRIIAARDYFDIFSLDMLSFDMLSLDIWSLDNTVLLHAAVFRRAVFTHVVGKGRRHSEGNGKRFEPAVGTVTGAQKNFAGSACRPLALPR
jgi:hypothetical protein